MGTFILGWIPAVVWYLVYCENCIFPFGSVQPNVSIAIGITVNSLIVLKSFLDPIIYTFRMNDFQVAFHRMRYQLTSKCCRPNKGKDGHQEGSTMISLNQSVLLRNNSHEQSPNFQQTNRFNRSSNHHLNNYQQTQAGHNLLTPNEQTIALVTVNEIEPTVSE